MIQSIFQPDNYLGTGLLTSYAFTFRILAKSDMVAMIRNVDTDVVTNLILDTDFTIADAWVNTDTGGFVVLTNVLAVNERLFLSRTTARTQLINMGEGGNFSSAIVTKAFDRLTMMIQELQFQLRQTLHLAPSSAYVDLEVPDPQAGLLLRWNNAEDGIENVLASALEITHIVVDVVVAEAAVSAVIPHGLGSATAKIIGFSSTFFTSFRVTSQTTNTITVELTIEAPVGGGTLTFEVAI